MPPARNDLVSQRRRRDIFVETTAAATLATAAVVSASAQSSNSPASAPVFVPDTTHQSEALPDGVIVNGSVPSIVVFLYFMILFHGDANIANG